MRFIMLIIVSLLYSGFIRAQGVGATPEFVNELTSRWGGARFNDGRPYVPDRLLSRLEDCTIEEIWGFLMRRGYKNQVVTDWVILKKGETMVGRAVTARFMPSRPDLDTLILKYGRAEKRSQSGGINIWPIDILTKGDIYVADGFGKIKDGTLIGSSLGNAIVGKTGKGVVFDGSVRDMQELKETANFNAWIVGQDPSFIRDMTPTSINAPIRVRNATVLPGDAVFANDFGVAFIPAYLLEDLVISAEMEALKDEFERFMLQQNRYDGGQIHGQWSDAIKNEFRSWFQKYPKKLDITLKEVNEYLRTKDD